MRWAWFTPVSEGSGISRYSITVAREIAALGDEIDLIAPPASDPLPAGDLRVLGIPEDPAALAGYDAVVYNMGNNTTHHLEIFEAYLRHPGFVVLHDKLLHQFFAAYFLHAVHDRDAYVGMMSHYYGLAGERFAAGVVLGVNDESTEQALPYPLVEPMLFNAEGAIVHSHESAQRVRGVYGDAVPVLEAGLPVELPEELPPPDRAALDLPDDAFVIVSHGHVVSSKRTESVLRAVAAVREHGRPVRFVVAGGGEAGYLASLRTLAEELGITDIVRFTGFLPADELWRYLSVADVSVNLRYPSTESASLSLLEQLGLGLPVVVLDVGSYAELPDDVALKVPLAEESRQLPEALARLMRDPSLGRALGEAGKRWVAEEHSPAGYARRVSDFVTGALALRDAGVLGR